MNFQVSLANGRIAQISLDPNITAKQACFEICKKFALDRNDLDFCSLVVVPRANQQGAVVPADLPLHQLGRNLTFDSSIDILDLYAKPVLVKFTTEGSARAEVKRILLDYHKPLYHIIPMLQTLFNTLKDDLFCLRARTQAGTQWMNSQKCLDDFNFDTELSYIALVLHSNIVKNFRADVVQGAPDRTGYMYKQSSGRDVTRSMGSPITSKELTKRAKRFFILKDSFLAYFKSSEDETPVGVVPLEYFLLHTNDEKSKEKFINVEKYRDFFTSKSTSSYLCFTVDPDHERDLRDWYPGLEPHCVNTGVSRVFGAPLQKILNSRKYKPWSVPPIVTQIIAYLDAKGLEAEGIFRLSGQASELVALREKIDRGEDVDFNVEVQQPHVVAALLKLWLRELPEPLLTFKLYTTFINTCMQLPKGQDKVIAVLNVLKSVPEDHLESLQAICSLLNRVAKFEKVNKMGIPNLALIIGPNILRPERELDPLSMLRDTPIVNDITQILIENDHALYDLVKANAAKSQRPTPRGSTGSKQAWQAVRGKPRGEVVTSGSMAPLPAGTVTRNTYDATHPPSYSPQGTTASPTVSPAIATAQPHPTPQPQPQPQIPPLLSADLTSPRMITFDTSQLTNVNANPDDPNIWRSGRRGGGKFDSSELQAALAGSGSTGTNSPNTVGSPRHEGYVRIEEYQKLLERVERLEIQLFEEVQSKIDLSLRLDELEQRLNAAASK